jgi:H/ACA ribonucleoprotein complex subunit 3
MLLKRCKKCGGYTLEAKCPRCKIPASRPDPSRFSVEDKYGSYRRKLKIEALKGD